MLRLIDLIDLDKVIAYAGEYEDGETGLTRCLELLLENSDLPPCLVDQVIDVALTKWTRDSALAAGVPLDVVEGKAKVQPIGLTFKGRPIDFSLSYAKDPVDCFIEEAWYTDGEHEVISEDHYEEIAEKYAAEVYERWNEDAIDRAEHMADLRRDERDGI